MEGPGHTAERVALPPMKGGDQVSTPQESHPDYENRKDKDHADADAKRAVNNARKFGQRLGNLLASAVANAAVRKGFDLLLDFDQDGD